MFIPVSAQQLRRTRALYSAGQLAALFPADPASIFTADAIQRQARNYRQKHGITVQPPPPTAEEAAAAERHEEAGRRIAEKEQQRTQRRALLTAEAAGLKDEAAALEQRLSQLCTVNAVTGEQRLRIINGINADAAHQLFLDAADVAGRAAKNAAAEMALLDTDTLIRAQIAAYKMQTSLAEAYPHAEWAEKFLKQQEHVRAARGAPAVHCTCNGTHNTCAAWA
jgi:hypothetical protein